MTDLSMVPSFLLNQSGNLVANESKSSEDEKSKYCESELNSLIPIGRRYGVRCSRLAPASVRCASYEAEFVRCASYEAELGEARVSWGMGRRRRRRCPRSRRRTRQG